MTTEAGSGGAQGVGGAPPPKSGGGCPHSQLKSLVPNRGTWNFVSLLSSGAAIFLLAKASKQTTQLDPPQRTLHLRLLIISPPSLPRGPKLFPLQGPTDLQQVVIPAGLFTAAAVACGVANSGLLPADSDAEGTTYSDAASSLLASPCATARRTLANTTFAGTCELVPRRHLLGSSSNLRVIVSSSRAGVGLSAVLVAAGWFFLRPSSTPR
jgi:hypothetical protein